MKLSPKTSGTPSPSPSTRSSRTQCPYVSHDNVSISSFMSAASAPSGPVLRPPNGPRGSNASVLSIRGNRMLPLTAKEIYRMRASWAAVHMKDAGLDTFFMMFKQHPTMIKYFERIQSEVGMKINDEKMMQFRMNMVIQRHAARVLRLMDSMIHNIDNPAQLVRLVDQAVHSHLALKCMRFEGQLFQSIVSPMVESMRRMLGARFNAHLESIYARAFRYLVTELCRGYDALPEPPDESVQEHGVPEAGGGAGGDALGCPFRGNSSPTPSPPGTPSGMLVLPPSPSELVLSTLPMRDQRPKQVNSEELNHTSRYTENESDLVFSPSPIPVAQPWCPFGGAASSKMTNNSTFKTSNIGGTENLSSVTTSSTASSTAATTSTNTSPVAKSHNGLNQMANSGPLKYLYEPQHKGEDQRKGEPDWKCPFSRITMIDAQELEAPGTGFGVGGVGEGGGVGGKRRAEQTPLVREPSGDSGLERERGPDRETDSDQHQQLVHGVHALNISGPSAALCPVGFATTLSCGK